MAKKTPDEAGAADVRVEPPAAETHATPRRVLFAGIAGACALGVGAGLWARPAADEQRTPPPAARAAAVRTPAKLEIVLTDPLGGPAAPAPAVTAAIAGPAVSAELVEPQAGVEPEPLAPVRRPEGLVRVQEVEPPEASLLERETAKAEAQKLEKARLAKARAETARHEKLKLEKARLQKAKLEKAKKRQADLKVAKAEPKETKLAVADTGAETDAAEGKTPGRLSRLKSAIAKPFKAHPKAEREVAKAEPKPAKTRKTEATRLAKAEPKESKAKSGSKRCVSSDPGAAIVCADPTLAAADRQLTRAYREAEAAGVPPSQLRSQQQRWLAARAAAAREAPWAVHDVYLARIAELNDLTRDAREGY